jgi:hypothetical protein
LCKAFKITRQALYKRRQVQTAEQLQEHLVVEGVHGIRRRMPRVGGIRKRSAGTSFLTCCVAMGCGATSETICYDNEFLPSVLCV